MVNLAEMGTRYEKKRDDLFILSNGINCTFRMRYQ